LHEKTFLVAVPAAIALVVVASGVAATISAAIYGVFLCALYGVSGNYHRRNWSPAMRLKMQRLDRATIYLMIAGTYTPLCVLVVGGWTGALLLGVVWAGAVGGFVLAFTSVTRRGWIGGTLYLALGWAAIAAFPALVRGLDTFDLALIIVGGLLYTVGSLVLARQWPDPRPATFGYHEVWHVFVVAASACHYVVVWNVVSAG
jgi:hemolysin III